MRIIRPQSSVKSFYDHVLKNQIPIEENLTGCITPDFQRILDTYESENGLRAIDLGYGYGNYSIALAQKGFKVTAVDYVAPDYFKERLQSTAGKENITIIERDLNLFEPKGEYDVVVCKDVFHFLRRSKVEELLNVLIEKTNKKGWHYIVIFTDIWRKSNDGNEIVIENEARFTSDYLVDLVNYFYRNWKVNLKIEEYREKDRSGKEDSFYFKANRVTIMANNI
jgi:cyclopropane fatty-acyl-phospholipid synthase-like methyltransferase